MGRLVATRASEDEAMTYDEWLEIGMRQGWCDVVRCWTHETVLTEAEFVAAYDGNEVCVQIVRLNPDST